MKNYRVYKDNGSVDAIFIEKFEEEMGYQFPIDYKVLISSHNALRLEEDCFDIKFEGKSDSRDIFFYGFGPNIKRNLMITRKQLNKGDCIRDCLIVFGSSSNGDYICFDYGEDRESPSIVLVLHDYHDDSNKMLICPVAETFDGFMDSLYE